jgi:hypothetical protein
MYPESTTFKSARPSGSDDLAQNQTGDSYSGSGLDSQIEFQLAGAINAYTSVFHPVRDSIVAKPYGEFICGLKDCPFLLNTGFILTGKLPRPNRHWATCSGVAYFLHSLRVFC